MADGRPRQELVSRGLADLEADIASIEALLVAIGAPRLRWLGVPVPPPERLPRRPERALYALLARAEPRGAHARYNALIRRLVSYEHALELEMGRRIRKGRG